nr:hypothetical protein [uncultured Pedobacter sp.]
MKKVIVTLMVGLFSAAAFAQTTTPATADKKKDMTDLRKDIKDERHDKQLRKYEVKHGDKTEAKAETKDINADKKGINSDVKGLKKDGIKHPEKRAVKQIHKQHVNRKH